MTISYRVEGGAMSAVAVRDDAVLARHAVSLRGRNQAEAQALLVAALRGQIEQAADE